MHTRFVVGYDGTEPSRSALRWALDRSDRVTVAHVVDGDAGLIGSDYRDVVEQAGRDILADALTVAAEHAPGRAVDVELLEGPVAWALTGFASSPGDLVVVGTHKTGFLHGRVLGSRSVEVALLARCDVVVVPGTDLRFRSGVVAGVTDDAAGDSVVEAAALIAGRRGEDLLLVHGRTPTASPDAALLAEARQVARAAAPDLVIRTRSSSRPISELLLDAGRDRALLVMGETRDPNRSPIGSVIHDVLLNLTTATLVVHAPTGETMRDAATSRIDRVG